MVDSRAACRILVATLEGKTALGTARFEWRAILRWILSDRTEVVDWIDLAQDRYRCKALVNAVMNHCTPLDTRSFWSS
jgi:hypothetical protein